MSEPTVEFRDAHLAFGEKEILSGVSLVVPERARLVILGQSGSGKSTLLRLILGILKPTRGDVLFKGHDLTRMSRRRLNQMRQRMGMVYQYSALISSLSVRDNLALVGMADARDKMPGELSGGMKKRIGLARGIIMDPQLILYDEPSAGLDPVISSVIDELIISLSEKIGATSIIVTHEMESAFKVATHMAMLFQGSIIAADMPENFKTSDNPIVAQFIAGDTHGPIQEGTAKS